MRQFLKNRQQFPPQELAKHAGQYVAWSTDGCAIVASDVDLLRLDAKLRDAGYDPAQTLVSSVPLEEVILGGGGSWE